MNAEKWYTAVLVINSTVEDNKNDSSMMELQFRLLKAATKEDAYLRAIEFGKAENHSYRNSDGKVVQWQFQGLHDLREVQDDIIRNGTEVYSHMQQASAEKYVVSKEELTVFWDEANKTKTADQILNQR